jgi:tetratricopeptide (TPR) repeat protein
MAGRKGLLLAVSLWTGLTGCSSRQTEDSGPQQTGEPPKAASKDLPKRQPKASTCVAMGQTSERAAEGPNRTPFEQQQLREQARRAYQQALRTDPGNLEALSCLGALYLQLNDNSHAVETYRKATEVAPKKASTWYELGMCQARLKDWQSAIPALQKAVELDPENRPLVHTYAFCLARAGNYDASYAAFCKVDQPAVAHYNLGRMLMHMKEENLAREHLRQSVQLDKDNAAAADMLVKLDEGAAANVPSPIQPVKFEQPATPIELSRPIPVDDSDGKNSPFSQDAATALRRVDKPQ